MAVFTATASIRSAVIRCSRFPTFWARFATHNASSICSALSDILLLLFCAVEDADITLELGIVLSDDNSVVLTVEVEIRNEVSATFVRECGADCVQFLFSASRDWNSTFA